jgi:hypothetical protein
MSVRGRWCYAMKMCRLPLKTTQMHRCVTSHGTRGLRATCRRHHRRRRRSTFISCSNILRLRSGRQATAGLERHSLPERVPDAIKPRQSRINRGIVIGHIQRQAELLCLPSRGARRRTQNPGVSQPETAARIHLFSWPVGSLQRYHAPPPRSAGRPFPPTPCLPRPRRRQTRRPSARHCVHLRRGEPEGWVPTGQLLGSHTGTARRGAARRRCWSHARRILFHVRSLSAVATTTTSSSDPERSERCARAGLRQTKERRRVTHRRAHAGRTQAARPSPPAARRREGGGVSNSAARRASSTLCVSRVSRPSSIVCPVSPRWLHPRGRTTGSVASQQRVR